MELDSRILLELIDHQTGAEIAIDIENRTGGYLVTRLARWVATIRNYEREKMLTNQPEGEQKVSY